MRDVVARHPQLGPDAALLFDDGVAVGRRRSPGGAGPSVSAVQKQRLETETGRLKGRFS
jgi:hypothetical protein